MTRRCFVTVGTTRFDVLICSMFIDKRIHEALKDIDVNEITLQMGASELSEEVQQILGSQAGSDEGKVQIDGLTINFYRFKSSIANDIKDADLVIGHAGAGTALEVLKAKKPFIAVINDILMNNHQSELAEKFAELEHLLFCCTRDLYSTLRDPKLFALTPYTSPPFQNVTKYLENLLGIA